jgi:hypothetical protein
MELITLIASDEYTKIAPLIPHQIDAACLTSGAAAMPRIYWLASSPLLKMILVGYMHKVLPE